ncbi:MAG: hypothetical protein AB7Q81_24345 [Gammaproteobacteria bacterium]
MSTRINAAGQRVEMSPEEEAAWAAAQPTDDVVLARRREGLKERFRAEANARIAAVFSKPPATLDLVYAQLNNLSQFVALLWLHTKGAMTLEQITPALDAALALFEGDIQAIRSAENAVSAALDAAGSDTQMALAERIAEIDAVTATWP